MWRRTRESVFGIAAPRRPSEDDIDTSPQKSSDAP